MKKYTYLLLFLLALVGSLPLQAQNTTDFWCGDNAMGHYVQIIASKSRCNNTQNQAQNLLTQGSVFTNCTLEKEAKGGYRGAKKYFKKNWIRTKKKLNKQEGQKAKSFITAGDLLFEAMKKKQKKK